MASASPFGLTEIQRKDAKYNVRAKVYTIRDDPKKVQLNY